VSEPAKKRYLSQWQEYGYVKFMHNRTGSDDFNELEELEAIRRKKLESLKHESYNKKGVEKMSSATEVKDSTFDDFVKANKIVIIDCWAPWCGPCRSLAPIIEDLAKEFEGKIVFGKLNTDENESIPMRFNISAIPTLLVFKNGEMVDRIVGAGNKEFMKAKFAKHLE
jgi:thioredoxin 1